SNATVVPLVFPLFAGAAAFTTLLNLQNQGIAHINLLVSVLLNMVLVYVVLRYVEPIERAIGKQGSYILRKVFGVILIAIAVKYLVNGVMGIIASLG
ncbi:MAG: MarC family protein, partial [Porphyromonas sp.]|nr:MarC family protein [Porphyromonas sp.]